ncbi:MAG: hypothetical protein ACRDDF_11260 [Aeromonas sp.]
MVFDSGKKCLIPKIEERANIVTRAHEEINHRGVEGTYYKPKSDFYWIGMKKTVKCIGRCEICKINYRKNCGGNEFVETTRELEKVALDLISLGGNNRYILVAIDYQTRFVLAEMIRCKNASTIVDIISKWGSSWKPEELITDNGKEFANEFFRRYCMDEKILHRLVSVESHKSNGRIERLIRTIREGLAKTGGEVNERS